MKTGVKLALSAVGLLFLAGCATNGHGLFHRHGGTKTAYHDHHYRKQTSSWCRVASARGGVNQHYYFAFDRSRVSSRYEVALRNQARYLLSHPHAKVRIEGNADDRGSREYNIALGWRRARAVRRFLRAQGVPSSRMVLISYGAERPKGWGHSEAARSCNRRADLVWTR